MKKRLILILSVLALLVTGCGTSKNSDSKAKKQQSDGSKSYNFIFVCPIIDNEYWQACIRGIERADAEFGTNTVITGPNDAANFSTEILGFMEDAIAQKPDGILAYSGIDDMHDLINQAGDEDIPFIAVDSDAPDTNRVAYVGVDTYNCGYSAGEKMVELTGGKAKIGIMVSSTSAEKEMEVINAFKDAVSDYDIEIVAMEETDADPDVAEQKAIAMLAKYPDIDAFFCTAGYNITGAARVKKANGYDDLILLGFDDVEENIKYVRENVINAIIVQNPEEMGYQSIYLMKEYIDNGKLSKQVYDLGIIFVTPENVDTYK